MPWISVRGWFIFLMCNELFDPNRQLSPPYPMNLTSSLKKIMNLRGHALFFLIIWAYIYIMEEKNLEYRMCIDKTKYESK